MEEDLDVDFDFKSMLSNLDDPDSLGADIFASLPQANNFAANRLGVPHGGPPLHPLQSRQQTLSMHEMLDSRLFQPDAPWSMGSGRQGLTAAPPPTFGAGNQRGNRSNSGALISTRLRAASDMHQQGFLTAEEKSLMKDLILSRNPKFKEEYANAEKTNNWYALQTFLKSFNRNSNNFSTAIDNLTTDFEALATPPPPLPLPHGGHVLNEGMTKAVRKRMASTTTPVARAKKTTSSSKKDQSLEGPAGKVGGRGMDLKELELEAAIAAADGDSEQVAKLRKNERERRRRLAVSNGFDELFELLKLPQAAQIDKVSILRRAIDRIKELEQRVQELEQQQG